MSCDASGIQYTWKLRSNQSEFRQTMFLNELVIIYRAYLTTQAPHEMSMFKHLRVRISSVWEHISAFLNKMSSSVGEDEDERGKGMSEAELFPLHPTQLGFFRKFWELQVSCLISPKYLVLLYTGVFSFCQA